MTDRRAAEILYPNQGGDWKIELRQRPIAHRGHAFLALVHKGEIVRELHGFGHSRHTDDGRRWQPTELTCGARNQVRIRSEIRNLSEW